MAPTADDWLDLSTPAGFDRCVRGSLREVYGYVALLVGDDRPSTEWLVADMYRSLFQAVRAGAVDSVSLGALRRAARDLWVERYGDAVRDDAADPTLDADRVLTIADLTAAERAVLVFRHVNKMSPGRVADELGISAAMVDVIEPHAVARLRGTSDASGRWMRAYFGDAVSPAPRLVDAIVHELGSGEPDEGAVTEAVPDGPRADSPQSTDLLATKEMTAIGSTEPTTTDATSLETQPIEVIEAGRADEPPTFEMPAVVAQTADAVLAEVPTEVPVEPVEPAAGVSDADMPAAVELSASSSKKRTVVVGALLAVVAAVGALAIFGRGGDTNEAATTPATAPSLVASDDTTVSSEPSATPLVSNTAPPTEVPASTAPTTAPPPSASPPGSFEPACVPVQGTAAAAAPTSGFGPIGADPALLVTVPLSVAGDTKPAATQVVGMGDGVLVVLSAHPEHGFWQTIVSRVGFDGAIAWTNCIEQPASVFADPATGALHVGLLADGTTQWRRLDVTDGTIGAPLPAADSTRLSDAAATRSADRWEVPSRWFSDGTRTVMSVNEGVATVTDCAIAADGCDLVGYDIDSAGRVWRVAGIRDIASMGSGRGLVADGDGWVMIDLVSGTPVDGQRWDDLNTFARAGEAPTRDTYVRAAGDTLVVARGSELAVYAPAEVASETVAVSLG